MQKYNFTKRELQIMRILWASNQPISAKEIAQTSAGISQNTVQTVLKKLLKRKIIKTDGVGYSGTVLTRLYTPIVTEADFLRTFLDRDKVFDLVASYIRKSDADELDQVERLINQKRQKK